jgi:hypothetical protein
VGNQTAIWALQMVHRSIYADQLVPFLARFPSPSQLLVLRSEDFFADEAATMARLCAFLGLAPHAWEAVVRVKYNFGKGTRVRASSADEARCGTWPAPHTYTHTHTQTHTHTHTQTHTHTHTVGTRCKHLDGSCTGRWVTLRVLCN